MHEAVNAYVEQQEDAAMLEATHNQRKLDEILGQLEEKKFPEPQFVRDDALREEYKETIREFTETYDQIDITYRPNRSPMSDERDARAYMILLQQAMALFEDTDTGQYDGWMHR